MRVPKGLYKPSDNFTSLVHHKTSIGIRISGDSMEPDIPNGSIVWVQERQQIENGQVGIFIRDGESYCKKLHLDYEKRIIRLLSNNPDYEPIELEMEESPDLRTVGLVLGHYGID